MLKNRIFTQEPRPWPVRGRSARTHAPQPMVDRLPEDLTSVEYADRLGFLTVPTLITAGDHDQVAPSISEDMHRLIAGSRLVVLPQSGNMTFVDQPTMFVARSTCSCT